MHVMINQYVVFDLFCVFIDGGVRVCVGARRGFKFSVRGPQNWVLGHFQAEAVWPKFLLKVV